MSDQEPTLKEFQKTVASLDPEKNLLKPFRDKGFSIESIAVNSPYGIRREPVVIINGKQILLSRCLKGGALKALKKNHIRKTPRSPFDKVASGLSLIPSMRPPGFIPL